MSAEVAERPFDPDDRKWVAESLARMEIWANNPHLIELELVDPPQEAL